MADYISIEFFAPTVEYKCPKCGKTMKIYESTVELLKENGKEYIFCDYCDNKVKL